MVIISEILGGFGNQLFSFCLGYVVSQKTGADFLIDTSRNDSGVDRPVEIVKLDLPYKSRITYHVSKSLAGRAVFNKLNRRRKIGFYTKFYTEKKTFAYDPDVFKLKDDTFLRGYWQNYKYFLPFRDELNRIIKFKDNKDPSYKGFVNLANQKESLAVHVRRGDYLKYDNYVLPMSYYEAAISRAMKRRKIDTICIFTDDADFCRGYFNKVLKDQKVIFPEYKSSNRTIDDLYLMSRFNNVVISNSTYGWWGAFLGASDKYVVCPDHLFWTGDFYLPAWKKIKIEKLVNRNEK